MGDACEVATPPIIVDKPEIPRLGDNGVQEDVPRGPLCNIPALRDLDVCQEPVDSDDDGVPDDVDNCLRVANRNQADSDRDGVGDACDNCDRVANRNQADSDRDGIGDACEPVSPVNHAPTLNSFDNIVLSEGQEINLQFSGVDTDGDQIRFKVREVCAGDLAERVVCGLRNSVHNGLFHRNNWNVPAGATFDSVTGEFRFAPAFTFVQHPRVERVVVLEFAATDGELQSEFRKLSITVIDVNRAPIADNKAVVTIKNKAVRVALSAQDADREDVAGLRFEAVGFPQHGTAVYNGSTVVYTPNDGFVGMDKFRYAAVDQMHTRSQAAIVTVTVSAGPIPDRDNDGIADTVDNCPDVANKNQADSDRDGVGDVCDVVFPPPVNSDLDNDGVIDSKDNCVKVFNPNQADSDRDGVGDVCDVVSLPPVNSDLDNDGVIDSKDNCVKVFNPNQADSDRDGVGDVCDVVFPPPVDSDSDNDGVDDVVDNCVHDYNPDQMDSDRDTIGDVCDDHDNSQLYENVQMQTVRVSEVVSVNDPVFVSVALNNNGKTNFRDARLLVMIPDLGVRIASGEFDLREGDEYSWNTQVQLPYDAPAGVYLVRFVFQDAQYHEVAYRQVRVR